MQSAFLSGLRHLIRVKGRVKGVEVAAVKFLLGDTEGFTETLVMHNLTLPQKLNRLAHIIVRYHPKDIVVGAAGFLFWHDLVSTTYTKI